jgi:hypothetical protein
MFRHFAGSFLACHTLGHDFHPRIPPIEAEDEDD